MTYFFSLRRSILPPSIGLLYFLFVVAVPVAGARAMDAYPSQTGQGGRMHSADKPDRAERKERAERKGERQRNAAEPPLPAELAPFERLSVMLGRPTTTTMTASIVATEGGEAYCEYGPTPGEYPLKTPPVRLEAGAPASVIMDRLKPDTRWYYRLRHRPPAAQGYSVEAASSFHTPRMPGQSFVFEVQGDSHPERRHQFDAATYVRTLKGAASDQPDFYLTMGDDFSVDTLPVVTRETVERRYALQRPYLSLVGRAAPLFLINGNHEQAAASNLDGSPNNVAVWAQNARNAYYPQPAPDAFYTGDVSPVPHIGLLRDYYAWVWGDALFVVIDPYWHSAKPVDNPFGGGQKNRDKWDVTLGEEQYRWFVKTLATSQARYKFVFTHHVLGSGRGGIELAHIFEWGGRNKHGEDAFATQRPGWAAPIHQVMVRNNVTVFFQGHDHVFAHQQLDGVVYQTVPQPADAAGNLNFADAYQSGDILPGPGRIRVHVTPEKVSVSYLAPPEGSADNHGQLRFAYQVSPK